MKPYFQNESCIIYHADFRELLQFMGRPKRGFEMCLTDPPYGKTKLHWDKWVANWPYFINDVLSPRASLWSFGTLKMFMEHAMEFARFNVGQEVIWEKHNGSELRNDRFRRVHEFVLQFYPRSSSWEQIYKSPVHTYDAAKKTVRRLKRPEHWGGVGPHWYRSEQGGPRLMRSVIRARSCHKQNHGNPTAKPVEVLQPLIEYSCPKGGWIIDPFMGSGSTLVAASLIGRCAMGIDMREDQCEKAALRLQASAREVLN